jgi:N-ethylmaleimide reductase
MPDILFTPVTLGELTLKNRILMSAMTRARAPERIPTASMATYYRQRAGAGLIITEATTVSEQGNGSIATPGIYSPEQVAGWRQVTSAVHEAGGLIACQLWHTGRVSHSSFQPGGAAPVSASAVHGEVNTFTRNGFERTTPPRALTLEEIPGIVGDFAAAAERAMEAGFDAVEIHAGSGYLLDQFLRDGTNRRGDAYGGSFENRCRLVVEVVAAVTSAIGAGRTGIRFSPLLTTWDCSDSDPEALFSHVFGRMNDFDLAFMDITERNEVSIAVSGATAGSMEAIRGCYHGNYVANGAYDLAAASEAVANGYCAAVSFGKPYISNPDLAERLAAGAPLNPPADLLTWYGGGDAGYIDFPTLSESSG